MTNATTHFSSRLLRLSDPTTWRSAPVIYRGKERLVWWLPGTRLNKIGMDQINGSWYYDDTTRQVVRNTPRLTTLIRMVNHMVGGHAVEVKNLAEVRQICRHSHVEILSLDMASAQGSEGDQILQKLGKALDQVGPVTNEDKVSAKERIAKVVFFKYKFYDKRLKREVVKIGAALATLVGALNDFLRRVEATRSMDAWLMYYSMMAQRIFVGLEECIGQSIQGLEKLAFDIDEEKPYQSVKDQIALHREKVSPLSRFRPFKRAGGYLIREAEQMQLMLDTDEFAKLGGLVYQSKVSLCALSLRCTLERSKTHVRNWVKLDESFHLRIMDGLLRHFERLSSLHDDLFKIPVLERVKLNLYALVWYLQDGDIKRALDCLDYILNLI